MGLANTSLFDQQKEASDLWMYHMGGNHKMSGARSMHRFLLERHWQHEADQKENLVRASASLVSEGG